MPNIEESFQAQNVPENVRSFHQVNMVDTFQLDRPFHKGERDKNNDFKVSKTD